MKKQIKKTISTLLLLTGLSMLVIACSGGDEGMGNSTNQSPISAQTK